MTTGPLEHLDPQALDIETNVRTRVATDKGFLLFRDYRRTPTRNLRRHVTSPMSVAEPGDCPELRLAHST